MSIPQRLHRLDRPRSSALTNYLKGKEVPVKGVKGKVDKIVAVGNDRVIFDETGHTTVVTKRKMVNAFNKVLTENQKEAALKSVKNTRDGRATVRLGGEIRGETKSYATKSNARRAAKNRYTGKPPKK